MNVKKHHILYLLIIFFSFAPSLASSSIWQKKVVSISPSIVPSNCTMDMSIDKNGYPHLVYGDKTIEYVFQDGEGWHTERLATFQSNGASNPQLALDKTGKPHISYYNIDNSELIYTTRELNGWTQTIFDYDTTCETMAIDSQGKPHMIISISDPNTITSPPFPIFDPPVNSYHLFNESGDWKVEFVGVLGRSSKILVDPFDKIHVMINHGLITYATNSSGSWRSEIINPKGWSANEIKTMQFFIDESQSLNFIYQMREGVYIEGTCYGDCNVVYFKHAKNELGVWAIQDLATTNHDSSNVEKNTITPGIPHYFGLLRQQETTFQYAYLVGVRNTYSYTLTYEIFPTTPSQKSDQIDELNLDALVKCKIDTEGNLQIFYYDDENDVIVYATNKRTTNFIAPILINLLMSNG